MTLTAGRMEIDVDADGKGFNGQIRRIMQKEGAGAASTLSKGFNTQLKKESSTFENAFRGISGKLAGVLQQGKSIRTLSDAWKGLGHNAKQWTLIIGAVAASMQQIAVLGSAAGAGLLILGGAAGGALVGVGALVAGLVRLAGDAEKVPDAIKPAAKAFRDLRGPLSDVMDFIAVRSFKGTEKAFASIGDTIRKLTPAFGPLGDAINRITNGFAEWSASEEGISLISGLIENSAPIFERVVGIVGRLGRTFLKAFDNPQFQKAIADMLDGIDGMFETFEKFVESDDFGVWIENTAEVMGNLGELLGATSDMFGDLITPEAYDRMNKFLDNLTDFMPHLGNLLDILGRLDIFGIIAEALATLGDALEPLAEPFGELADQLSRIIEIAIDEWGDQLKPIAEALAPFVQGLADLIADVPASTIRDIAKALGILAGGLLLFNAVKWVGAISGLTGFFASIGAGNGIVKSFNLSKLKGLAKGLGAFALIGAAQLIPKSFWEQFNIESNLPESVLTGAGFGLMFGGWGIAIGAGIGLVVSLFTDFEGTMNDVGFSLLSIFSSGPFGTLGAVFAQFFADLVPEEWRQSGNPLELLLSAAQFLITDTGTAILIVADQIGQFFSDLGANLTTWASTFVAGWSTMWTTLNNPAFWNSIGVQVNAWLAMMVGYFRGKVSEMLASWSGFWLALGTVVAGNTKRIIALVTALVNGVKAILSSGLRGAAGAWNSFWGGLPNVVSGAVGRIIGLVNGLMGAINRALGGVGALSRAGGAALGGGGGGGNVPAMAAGGILSGPRRILAGEAGPEAIVPLRRALSQVDPSVRWLSALAQGRGTPAMASGGVVGGGRVNNINAGAIVVQDAGNPLATGVEMLNRLTQDLI